MRKLGIVLGILALVLLVGCGQTQVVVDGAPQQAVATQPAAQNSNTATQPVQAATPTQAAPQTTSPSSMITPVEYDKKVKALMDNAAKIKSYAFYYTDKETQLESDHYFVKGNKIAIRLFDVNEWNTQYWVDTLYIDMGTKTAVGYCERRETQRCTDHEKQYRIDYTYFVKKFQLDWLNDIPPSAKVTSAETIDDRFTDIVEYTDAQGKDIKLSMDRTYGVPLRVYVNGKQAYYYRDMAFNAVKDANLVHQAQ